MIFKNKNFSNEFITDPAVFIPLTLGTNGLTKNHSV